MSSRMRSGAHLLITLAALLVLLPPAPAAGEEADNVFKAGEHISKSYPGRWRSIDDIESDEELTDEQRAELERLRSIGYLTGSVEAPNRMGVTVHEKDAVYAGLNFFSSGHRPGAALLDMDGDVLHEWSAGFLDVWPGMAGEYLNDNSEYWRSAYLFENGDVLVIFEGYGLAKLDKDSNVLWARLGGEHHEVQVADDGSIYSLSRVATTSTKVRPGAPILEDFVVVLGPDGNEILSFSVLDGLLRSEYAYVLDEIQIYGDIFHTNAMVLLEDGMVDGVPEFRKGSILLSLRIPNLLAILDMEIGEITWATRGEWRSQHDPSVLPGGTVLLFDNKGYEEKSRLIEFDPRSGDVVWTYVGEVPALFFSLTCGTVQRLPNGNTLATESDRGRAIEVTQDGSIVWEYLNPERAGEDGRFIATIFEMTRLPADFPLDWLAVDE
ncbi:MAG: arylsulfotransferase family protein [Candidatus Eisenbacteria bacterium]